MQPLRVSVRLGRRTFAANAAAGYQLSFDPVLSSVSDGSFGLSGYQMVSGVGCRQENPPMKAW